MKKRRAVFVENRGTPAFPRYIVTESSGRVWTGLRWGTRAQRPVLFADVEEAAKVAQVLLQSEYKDASYVERHVVPIYIEVRSKKGIAPDDVKRWLRQAMSVTVAYGDVGNGPTDDSLVLLHVDWSEFFQVSGGPAK